MFISDHKPIETRIKLDPITAVHEMSSAKYAFTKTDYEILNKNMKNEPFYYNNANELVRKWYNWFWGEINKIIPRHQTERSVTTMEIDLLLISNKMTQNPKQGKKIILM